MFIGAFNGNNLRIHRIAKRTIQEKAGLNFSPDLCSTTRLETLGSNRSTDSLTAYPSRVFGLIENKELDSPESSDITRVVGGVEREVSECQPLDLGF